MNDDPVRGVPGEGDPRRNTLRDEHEIGDSNRQPNLTVDRSAEKQKNCGSGCRPDAIWPRKTHAPLDIARDLIERGIAPVPIPAGKKNPVLDAWQHLKITAANIYHYFNGAGINVGGIWGPKSHGYRDVDLDCVEAVALARYFLPTTHSLYGRASKRRSHYLYKGDDYPFQKGSERFNDETRKCIVELRHGCAKGAQSVMPGSVHKDTGERYAWDEDGAPGHATCAELMASVSRIAVGTLMARHWPASGRHDGCLRVGGFLARCGWQPDDIEHFTFAMQTVAGVTDPTHVKAGCKAAVDAANNHIAGDAGYGYPALVEFFGEGVTRQIAKYAGFRSSGEHFTSEQGFEVDQHGQLIKTSQRNIRKALELLDIEIRYDTFHDLALISGLEGYEIINDAAMIKLWLLVDESFRLLPSKDFFFNVVEEAARRNSFHPVRDYLDDLQWDGVPRIDRWLITYGQADDTEYVRAVGAIVLIAAVRRVRQPGCKFDEMLILEAPQGLDKSTVLSTMAVEPEWFSDDLPLNADGKKVIEQLRGKWIVEAAEMSGMRRADVEHLKAMLSRQVDRGRLAYGRITTECPRQSIVIGTTNESIYLKDLTGNRRFWPVKVKSFDVAAIRRDRDQLWAEAAAREARGESIRLKASLWEKAAGEQAERTVSDPWFELLGDVLGNLKGKLLAADAWLIVGVDKAHRTQPQNERLGRAMKVLNFERKKFRFGGEPEWCYARGTPVEQEKRIVVIDAGRTRRPAAVHEEHEKAGMKRVMDEDLM